MPLSARAEVHWAPSWDDALRQASAESKFIVLDVAASWCGPCQWMAREVYPDPRFGEFSKTQVFMVVDAEEGEGVELARRFRVDRYPSILVLDSQGKEIDRITGGRNYKRGQYAEAIRLAERALELEKDPAQQERIRANLKAFRAAAKREG